MYPAQLTLTTKSDLRILCVSSLPPLHMLFLKETIQDAHVHLSNYLLKIISKQRPGMMSLHVKTVFVWPPPPLKKDATCLLYISL